MQCNYCASCPTNLASNFLSTVKIRIRFHSAVSSAKPAMRRQRDTETRIPQIPFLIIFFTFNLISPQNNIYFHIFYVCLKITPWWWWWHASASRFYLVIYCLDWWNKHAAEARKYLENKFHSNERILLFNELEIKIAFTLLAWSNSSSFPLRNRLKSNLRKSGIRATRGSMNNEKEIVSAPNGVLVIACCLRHHCRLQIIVASLRSPNRHPITSTCAPLQCVTRENDGENFAV